GVYRVGPARITTRDPLGLAERSRSVGAPDRLVVYPRVDPLEGLPLGRGQDPTTQAAKVSFSQTSGEDFYTLREYRHGDDLRRVHWPSSAKRDELMIRQLEIPWTSRALVLLDPRNDRYRGPDAFEQAVRGAASVLRHLYRSGYSPRLWTGPGAVGAPISTATAYDLAMEELATVRTLGGLDLAAAVGRLRRTGMAGGILVVVTGTPDETVGALHRSLGEAFHRSIVLVVDDGNLEGPARLARGGALVVRAAPGDAWTVPWRTTMESAWSTATAG
ncbi:MAG TPA: DUF58 domain-containing protein, partial [Actinobacteria bacterium]|nr:DUF58 domain-containing protein [Actinomycetota bacterium]